MLRTMPTMDATAREVILAVSLIGMTTPLSAQTKMTAVMMRLRLLEKSIWFSMRLRIPMAEIIPYRMKEIPPMTAVGMSSMTAANFGEKERTMAKQAAMRMTLGS